MVYDIFFQNFDFDKLVNFSETNLREVASVIHTDIYGKLDRSKFNSAEEVKREMNNRKIEENKILESIKKICEEMSYLGFVGSFVDHLKKVESENVYLSDYRRNSKGVDNVHEHLNNELKSIGITYSSGYEGKLMVYSNFMYNEYKDVYIEIAEKGISFKSFTGSKVNAKAIVLEDIDKTKSSFDLALEALSSENYATAFSLLLQLAKEGNAEAQFYVAKMYYKGIGVEEDKEEALTWMQNSAEQHNAGAEVMLEEYLNIKKEKDLSSIDDSCSKQDDSIESIDLEEFVRGFTSDPESKFYAAPDLPSNKIKNFMEKYIYEIDRNQILFYFDETIFGSGDSGVVIDTSSININISYCKDCCVMIHRIDAVEISGLLNKKIVLKLSDGEKISFVLTQSNKGASLLSKAIQRAIDLTGR